MRTPAGADEELATVVAAQRGDREALDALAAGDLPLVYNIVGRAMNGHPDVDDVVQETMLRAVRGVGDLRDPAAFRSWLVAIAIRQVRDSYRDRLRASPPAVEFDAPVADFTDQTIERLGLSGQRLQRRRRPAGSTTTTGRCSHSGGRKRRGSSPAPSSPPGSA